MKWVPGIFPGGKGGRCVGPTTLPPSCAECVEISERQPPGTLRGCRSLYRNWFTFYRLSSLQSGTHFLIRDGDSKLVDHRKLHNNLLNMAEAKFESDIMHVCTRILQHRRFVGQTVVAGGNNKTTCHPRPYFPFSAPDRQTLRDSLGIVIG
jgi:hypothetical protein